MPDDPRPDPAAPPDKPKPEPPVPLTPSGERVPEGRDHLKSREDAFQRRRGQTPPA